MSHMDRSPHRSHPSNAPRPSRHAGLSRLALLPLLAAVTACSDPGSDVDTQAMAERAAQGGAQSGEMVDRYQDTADQLLTLLEHDDNADQVDPLARELLDQSLPLLDSVALRYTECTDYLDQATTLVEQLPTLDSEALDRGYRQGQGLPEAAPRCHDAAELLTEPAMVVLIANEQPDDWQGDVRHHISIAQARLEQLRSVLSVGQE